MKTNTKKAAMFAAHSEKMELNPPAKLTKLDRAMQEMLGVLEDIDDKLFWKMLFAVTDFSNEQMRLAFTAGFDAGTKTKAELSRTAEQKGKAELKVVAA